MQTWSSSAGVDRFVQDEILRAPLLFDQVVEGMLDEARKAMPMLNPAQRMAMTEVMQTARHKGRDLCEYFVRSLNEQVNGALKGPAPGPRRTADIKPLELALVDEEEVALNVELSHTIELIKTTAEYELRELQTFLSALVGDMDVARDYNPFRPETFARALWASAHGLPLSRAHQVLFMRHAGRPLAQLLRTSYAAASSRLESQGVEPAAHRTLILPAGPRRGARSAETTFAPDLARMRDTMPAPLTESVEPQPRNDPSPANRAQRQAIELVNRLFEAMAADRRVPVDVLRVITGLRPAATRLCVVDVDLLQADSHPLWRFLNRLVFEAEMMPDAGDPARLQLLRTGQIIVQQLVAETQPHASLYNWAIERLENYLQQGLARRLAASSSQIGALQKLEARLNPDQNGAASMPDVLDLPRLDTVPAALMDGPRTVTSAPQDSSDWLDRLCPGRWVRLFMQGRWVHARVLWPGDRRLLWLFGDGASDAAWAVHRAALQTLHQQGLAKTLRERSIVGSAASRVQEQMSTAAAA